MDWTRGLDSWTGLWTEIWTGFWTDTQFNDDHFQHSVALNGLGYALATAYPRQGYCLAALNKQSVPCHCLFLKGLLRSDINTD